MPLKTDAQHPAAKWVHAEDTEEVPKRPPTKSIAGIKEYRT
jgi:hypothetical protein